MEDWMGILVVWTYMALAFDFLDITYGRLWR